ncbi:MAG: FadR family transcriptional regulator [Anaerolineales bacterium]|nr:FadR family transcriptional regulator [Anaerolineales bacterium]QYK50461.1 MAG: FadR family transcriptional regulator [Anaerolineales bacterium]
MLKETTSFDFIKYLANGNGSDRLPSLQELSAEHGVSISVLREQLQVARALGFVEVRPRTGIKRLPYTFAPAVRESLFYAMDRDRAAFDRFSDVRRHLERAYWYEAVERLTPEDVAYLRELVDRAEEMLQVEPIRVPHAEHRELHLVIYRHLENPFVLGLLEAYWEAYEQVGLSRYTGLAYQVQVWNSHRQIVEAIANKDFERGHQLLNGHFDLIDKRDA